MNSAFCCSFACGSFAASGTASTSSLVPHWVITAGVPSIDSTTVRAGGSIRSMRCNAAGSQVSASTRSLGTQSAWIVRVYVYFTSLPGGDCTIMGANNCHIRFKSSDSSLYCHDTTNGFGATGVAVTTGQWYRIDFQALGAAIDAKVDGTSLGQRTTASVSASVLDLGVLTSSITADMYFSDVVISFDNTDYPIGAGYVNHFVPTSDGTHSGLGANEFERTLTGTDIVDATTTAFQLVDDVPLESGASVDWINMVLPSAAADYVECVCGPAAGISTPTAAPRAVEVIAGIHQAGTGAGNMEIRMNDNGTTNAMYTATGVAGVTAVNYKRKHYVANIANGGAWTVAAGAGNFNNLRVRFGSPAAVDANPDQYFDCIMIEAEFAEVVNTETNSASAILPQVWNRGFGAGSPSVLYSPCR